MLQLIPLKEFFNGRYGVITRERLQVAYGSLQIELSGSSFQYLLAAIHLKQLLILFLHLSRSMSIILGTIQSPSTQ